MYKAEIVIFDYAIAAPFILPAGTDAIIKWTLAKWTGLAFKMPRTSLEESKSRDELKQTGIYFLFRRDEVTNKGIVYISQAGVCKNGEGIRQLDEES